MNFEMFFFSHKNHAVKISFHAHLSVHTAFFFHLTCYVYLNYLHAMWSLFFHAAHYIWCCLQIFHANMWNLIASVRNEMKKVPKNVLFFFVAPHAYMTAFFRRCQSLCTAEYERLMFKTFLLLFYSFISKTSILKCLINIYLVKISSSS